MQIRVSRILKASFAALIGLACTPVSAQSGAAPEKTIRIETREGLLFDPVRFQIGPGTDLEVVVANTDTTDLPHNLVFLAPGKRAEIVLKALELGVDGPERQYLPESEHILAATRLIEHGKAERLRFEVPDEAGVYPYVCTFPGHGQLMFGAMYVGTDLPPIAQDPHVPPTAYSLRDGKVSSTRPNLYRMFMPNSGPASIAVALPEKFNYCWDAGACCLRYVWIGDFLDCQRVWNSKGDALAEILGEVRWSTEPDFPFSFAQLPGGETPRFRGYRMENGIPEFRYEVGEITIRERLEESSDGALLRRHFTLDGVTQGATMTFESADSPWAADRGERLENRLHLAPEDAASFALTFDTPASQ